MTSKVVSGSTDKTVRVWDISDKDGDPFQPQPLRPQMGENYIPSAFSSDGSKIVSGLRDKTICVWDASTGTEALPPLRGA